MLLEVATLMTPIVCSDIPQNQVIFNHDQVYYFPSKNVDALQHQLEKVLSEPEDSVEKAKLAVKHVQNNYSIEKVVEKYKQLYKYLIAQ